MEGPARPRCVHCELPLPPRCERFCCTGCRVVHHLWSEDAAGRNANPDRLMARLVVSALLAMGVMVCSLSLYGIDEALSSETAEAVQGLFRLGALALSFPVLILLGAPLAQAVVGAGTRSSTDALILAGVAAAWCVSLWNTLMGGPSVYFDTATGVLVLFTLGRWLDTRARDKARRHLRVLVEGATPKATRVQGGDEEAIDPSALQVGDRVRVRPGEPVPVDGEVLEGRSFLETACLTGEEAPRSVVPGDTVLAGCRLVDGSLLVRVRASVGTRLIDEIERRLADASLSRAALVKITDRVSTVFLPLVLLLALGTVILHWRSSSLEVALTNGLSVVLIACPCALGLATPLAFWAALGRAWRRGALVQSAEVLERLARARRVFLDKTGTLTTGEMRLGRLELLSTEDEPEALALAAALEQGSEHPLARALERAWQADRERPRPAVEDFRALPGIGVEGRIADRVYRLGRSDSELEPTPEAGALTSITLSCEGREVARFHLSSKVRAEAQRVMDELRALRLSVRGLTGDGQIPAQALGKKLGLDMESRLLPHEKAERIRSAGARGSVFVGDGLNDSLALATADVGIAMSHSSPTSLESASINLMRDDLHLIPELLNLGRSAVRTAGANLAWAFGYNAIGLGLAAAGRLTPLFAASAMVVSSLVVVLNSARLAGASRQGDSGPLGEQPAGAASDGSQAAPFAEPSRGLSHVG